MVATEDSHSLDNLVAARNLLKTTLDKSKALSSALQKSTPSMVLAFQQPNSTSPAKTRAALLQLQAHIDCAVAPATAVVEVFVAVRGLERSLASDPCSDLATYLGLMNRYEEGLRFLASSCSLAIRWLEDTPEFVTHRKANEPWVESLSKSVEILQGLVARKERAWLQGGPLRAAMDRLEFEFRRILTEIENDSPLLLPPAIDPRVINKLEAILERLAMSKCGRCRLPNCVAAYVGWRVGNARAMVRALDLDYLQKQASESPDRVECLELDTDRWCEHLEFAVKRVLEPELNLCRQLFRNKNNAGSSGHQEEEDVGSVCFEKIVTESGILRDFLRFGNDMVIRRSRDSPIKLLKLVDMFAVLDRLRPDLDKLFGAGGGSARLLRIQTLARNFIEQLACAARGIFCQLSAQVASQRQTPPPGDGSVPRVVSFVADHCNLLLGEHYKPALTQILRTGSTWSSLDEDVVGDEIRNVMKELDLRLKEWGNAYEDDDDAAALSSVFAMNTRRHLWWAASGGTEVGRLMGEGWVRRNAQLVDHHLDLYIQRSWGSQVVAAALKNHSSWEKAGGEALKKKKKKKRARAFCKMLHQTVKRQSGYVVWDEGLREEIRQRAVKAVVPAYRKYVADLDGGKGIYSAEGLEKMVRSLFGPYPNPNPNPNQGTGTGTGTGRCSLVGEEEEEEDVLDLDSHSGGSSSGRGSPMSPPRHSFSSSSITATRVSDVRSTARTSTTSHDPIPPQQAARCDL